jgi:hypothetical protein
MRSAAPMPVATAVSVITLEKGQIMWHYFKLLTSVKGKQTESDPYFWYSRTRL